MTRTCPATDRGQWLHHGLGRFLPEGRPTTGMTITTATLRLSTSASSRGVEQLRRSASTPSEERSRSCLAGQPQLRQIRDAPAWDNCGSVNEPWNSLDTLNQKWVVPIGTRASNNYWRWSNAEYSAIVDKMGTLPLAIRRSSRCSSRPPTSICRSCRLSDHPGQEAHPFDTTHWTGWPTHDNPTSMHNVVANDADHPAELHSTGR